MCCSRLCAVLKILHVCSQAWAPAIHLQISHTRWQSITNLLKPHEALDCSRCWCMSTSIEGNFRWRRWKLVFGEYARLFCWRRGAEIDHKGTLTRSGAPFIFDIQPKAASWVWLDEKKKRPGAHNIINIEVNVRVDEHAAFVGFCWPTLQSISWMYCELMAV